ncbi:MAG: cytidylate kinase family protein, partial [bacterium]
MAIITISRGTFSGGQMLAECLAKKLGYKSISREILIEAAEKYGISENNLTRKMRLQNREVCVMSDNPASNIGI